MRGSCSIEGCDKRARTRGWCNAHYERWRKHGDPEEGSPQIMVRGLPCKVDGCDRKVHGQHLCKLHYRRFVTSGDTGPLDVLIASTGKPYDFALQSLATDTNDCILWPFGKSKGYGSFARSNNYGESLVHRWVCVKAHGPAPDNRPHAAHSCGNRACINKNHLRWATRSENEMDKVDHVKSNRGERSANAKLTEDQVREIRLLIKDRISFKSISNRYNVSEATIYSIAKWKNWYWLDPENNPNSQQD